MSTENIELRPDRDLGAHDWHDFGPLGARSRTDVRTGLHVTEHASGADLDFPELIPVRVAPESSQTYSAYTVPCFLRTFAEPTSVLGRNDKRTKTFITNNGAVAVLIGPRAQVSAGVGYQLAPGKELSPTMAGEVFGVVVDGSPGGTVCTVSVWAEYGV